MRVRVLRSLALARQIKMNLKECAVNWPSPCSWWRSHICCRWHFAATVAYRPSSSLSFFSLFSRLFSSSLLSPVVFGFWNNGNAITTIILNNQKESNNITSKSKRSKVIYFPFVVVFFGSIFFGFFFFFVFWHSVVFHRFATDFGRKERWLIRECQNDFYSNGRRTEEHASHRSFIWMRHDGIVHLSTECAHIHTGVRARASLELSLQWISWQNSCVILKAFHAISFAQADICYGRLCVPLPLQRTHLSMSSSIFFFIFEFLLRMWVSEHQRHWFPIVFGRVRNFCYFAVLKSFEMILTNQRVRARMMEIVLKSEYRLFGFAPSLCFALCTRNALSRSCRVEISKFITTLIGRWGKRNELKVPCWQLLK